jgi:hypothetical protein
MEAESPVKVRSSAFAPDLQRTARTIAEKSTIADIPKKHFIINKQIWFQTKIPGAWPGISDK